MERKGEKSKSELLFVGHLEEEDNLKKWKRDAPLVDTEKNREDLQKISDAIVDKIKEAGRKAIVFVTSPKIRSKETAHLAGEEIKRRLGEVVKIRYATEEDLKAPEEGEFILPENYAPGEFFEGLKIARDIFVKESLDPSYKNLHYRFGDPILQADGSYKYPELAKYFSVSGETYAESLIRIFNSVIKMSEKASELYSNVEVIIVAHGFTFHILRGLVILGENIERGDISINPGEIAEKLWEVYRNRTNELRDTMYAPLDITGLENQHLIALLQKEVNYLNG